jgi:hypothetical protein
MSSCRAPDHGSPPVCPANGRPSRPVPRRTVESLVRPELRATLRAQPYSLCESPDCDVVYVAAAGDHVVTKDELSVRVGFKEHQDPVPLCYCFGVDRAAIRAEVRLRGDSDAQRDITARVRAGECRCEDTNPAGGCCLPDIAHALREARALHAQRRL